VSETGLGEVDEVKTSRKLHQFARRNCWNNNVIMRVTREMEIGTNSLFCLLEFPPPLGADWQRQLFLFEMWLPPIGAVFCYGLHET